MSFIKRLFSSSRRRFSRVHKQRGFFLINPFWLAPSGPATLTVGLTAASGLKKVIPAWGGNSIRVRASSNDTEADIPFSGTSLDNTALLAHTGGANAYANYDKVALYVLPNASGGIRCVKGHPCTIVGDAQVSTALGFPTMLFDGTLDRVDVKVSNTVQIGSGSVRIRCKIRAASLKVGVIIEAYGGSSATSMFYFQLNNTSGAISAGFYSGGSTVGVCTSANGTIAINTTYDVEFGRDGSGNCQLSVDGVSKATATTTATINGGPSTIYIGGENGASSVSFNGHIWALSIEPGVAAHTGSFTPDAIYNTNGDGFITKAYDQSGNGNDDVQSTLTAQPMIVNNGSALTDIKHDFVDDFFVSTNNTSTTTAITALIKCNNRTVASGSLEETVLEHTVDANSHKGFYMGYGNSTGRQGCSWGITDGTGNLNAITDNAASSEATSLKVYCGKFDKTQTTSDKRKAYLDGTQISESGGATNVTGTVGTSGFDAAKLYVGASTAGTNNFSKLNWRTKLIYEVAKSDADIATIGALM